MNLKHVKLYRSITINGLARESISNDIVHELRFLLHINMAMFKDKRNLPVLIPVTNIEHMILENQDFEELDKAFNGLINEQVIATEVEPIEISKKQKRKLN